ncbi:DUF3300 domain-containing protein [Xanthomonas maliensis]|uniref:DUF3300 domain-containing protein n=1 Tax=Xanthomonas maliensis TaxID=1321368 RepID=UPI0003A19FD5|nr:DUF3300 domain-containing protein [Xanthomonas maliensis]KAB7762964.1 DUF3300 domain-containing protein [Xanthomonas maliensis]
MNRIVRQPARLALAVAVTLNVLALSGCPRDDAPPATSDVAPAPAAATIAQQPAPPYTPPTADQLEQLVAPIALFPDKLLAQTLAASVYPDQVTTAQDWLRSNRSLSTADRAQASASQPWDPSIKALTMFPDVVDQLAGNLDWTRALGDAYSHDPNDVFAAVQVMRQRAQASGHLRSTPQMRVQVAEHAVVTPVLDGERLPPPSRVITIEPAEHDVVYVPRYDPEVVYGAPVEVYRSYRYHPVRYYDDGPDLVTTGLVSFGVGVLVGSALEHHHGWSGWFAPQPAWHDWGWNNWGVNWYAPRTSPQYVVYQNHVYAPRTTVINNINNTRNTYVDAPTIVRPGATLATAPSTFANAAMAARPASSFAPAGAFAGAGNPAARPAAMAAMAQNARALPRSAPDFSHLTAPHFTSNMLQAGRPVAALPPAPSRLPLAAVRPSPSLAALQAHGNQLQPPHAAPFARQVASATIAPRIPADMARTQHPQSMPSMPSQAALAQQRPRWPAAEPRMAELAAHNQQPSHALQRMAPPVRNLPQPHEQPTFANARPQRASMPQQRPPFAERSEPHPQRMASFAPPRAPMPHPQPSRPAPSHPQQAQHHEHDKHTG